MIQLCLQKQRPCVLFPPSRDVRRDATIQCDKGKRGNVFRVISNNFLLKCEANTHHLVVG